MDMKRILQNFGLTDAEINVFLLLLQFGELTASEIAKKVGMNRTFTYDRLKKLGDMGLVGFIIKDNKKYFEAAEPSQLLAILQEKESQIKSILPKLEKLRVVSKEGPEVKVFSSKKGVRTALNLILKDNKLVHIQGSISEFQKRMDSYFAIWNSQRIKRKIKAKILSNGFVQMELAESTLLSEEKSSSTKFMFGNKVITVMWADTPVAILIESKEIAEDNIAFFNDIWNKEIKIYSGVDGLAKAFFELIEKKTKFHYGLGYSYALSQIYGKKLSDDWHVVRLKNKIVSQYISYDGKEDKNYFRGRMKKWQDFNIRFLDKITLGPTCVTISEHMIVTFIYTEKDLKVIVNKNKETIAAYKKHFESLWKKAKG